MAANHVDDTLDWRWSDLDFWPKDQLLSVVVVRSLSVMVVRMVFRGILVMWKIKAGTE